MKDLILLGSTGSIGTQTLDIVREARSDFRVVGLAARRSWREVLAQTRELRPRFVALTDPAAAERIAPELPDGVALLEGPDAAAELAAAAEYDLAIHGIVGAAGLRPSVEVLRRGRALALANKESLVVAGAHLMELSRRHAAPILPVDSEHSAIFQCLRGEDPGAIRRILLTASGGPLWDHSPEELARVTPASALAHPNWDMGPRISIGSATLMNKALEVIETHHLFGLGRDRIQVVVHRQSVVHSMVEFVDGSVMAQMGPPDMRGPIHFALHHPRRSPSGLTGFDPALFRTLTFEEPDLERFPALELGYRCVEEEGDSGCVLNAADEVAVEAFLSERIAFPDIARVNERVLDRRKAAGGEGVDALLRSDAHARELARAEVEALAGIGTN